MSTNRIKLSPRHRFWSYTVFSFLFGSGVIWLWAHYLSTSSENIFSGSNTIEAFSMKIHGAAAMAMLIVLGSLIPVHMKRGWTAHVNRWNGIILISVNIVLILTGYGLYYTGDDDLRNLAHVTHVLFGLTFPLFLIWHIWSGRKLMHAKKLR